MFKAAMLAWFFGTATLALVAANQKEEVQPPPAPQASISLAPLMPRQSVTVPTPSPAPVSRQLGANAAMISSNAGAFMAASGDPRPNIWFGDIRQDLDGATIGMSRLGNTWFGSANWNGQTLGLTFTAVPATKSWTVQFLNSDIFGTQPVGGGPWNGAGPWNVRAVVGLPGGYGSGGGGVVITANLQ